MSSEILSIIAVAISGVTAIYSTSIPAILSFLSKKAELKAQKAREQEQAYNAKFEVFYQNHLKILKDFLNLYGEWKINPDNSTELLEFISTTAPEFRLSTNHWLYEFADKVKNYKPGDNLDEDYDKCKNLILHSYGVRVSADTPDYLMSEMLKVVLKERFDELQHATSEDFNFHSY